ncbi:MAG: sulfatase-like hydrolase/transferase [Planctomycetes bacterium]|nr:sulfatase-like hydrolase/transferase [Planctomycetota bacterium]
MSPWLACYGDPTVATPNLDRLAAESVRFTHAFATSPVCAPARSSLITGCHATRIGTMQMRNNAPSQAAIAKNPEAYREIPGYEGLPPPFVRCFPETLRGHGYYCTNNSKKDYQFREPATVWDESSGKAHWRGRAPGQPFFAVFNHNGTHESHAFPDVKRAPAVVDPAEVPLPPFYPDTANVRDAMARTYDNIAAMDRWVGNKLRELEQAGLLDTTIVVFFSDHGVGLPRGKRSCYDTGTRVPLLVRFPDGFGAGTVDERVVSFVDFGPTVLSLCGIEPDSRLDGVPFFGAFAREGRGLAFAHADRFDAVYDRARSVSDGHYRYVRNYLTDVPYLIPNAYRERLPMTAELYALRAASDVPAEQWQMAATTRAPEELYDSTADPWEIHNLIDAPAQRERLAGLRQALDAWIERTGDLGFVLPETRLVREHIWPPDGEQPTTPAAEIHEDGGAITIRCPESGASIGWRRAAGDRLPWNVYTGPFRWPAAAGTAIEVLTHRIGHRPTTVRFEVPNRRPPNLVFVLVDDLGYMDVRPNNEDSLYDTPNIARLAASGMRFTNGYAACPVCSPTRYSILTGRYPTRAGLTNYFSGKRVARFRPAESGDRMALAETTIAEALKAQGYATFFAGKWHLGPSAEFWPEAQGFDVNKGGHERGGPYGGDKYFSPYGNPRLDDGPAGEHLPARLARETCEFIESHRDGPFLAYLSFYSVHTPLMGREDLVQKYRDRIAALPAVADDAEFLPEEQVWPNGKPRRTRALQRHAVYAAMVEAMDAAVGTVLDRIDELGLAEDTIVVFTSDNGGLSTSEGSPTSNLPLRGGKGWTYEGGIREPWLVRVPGVTAPGSLCDLPICSIDVLPTLLDLAGLPPVEHEIDGVSFAPALRGESIPAALRDRALFWHYPHYGNQGGFPAGAVRRGRWKLIERLEDGRVHLFDLEADLGERNDLAAREPERVAELRALLHGFYERFDARFLEAKDGVEPWRPR